jgi:hypothetical protein
MEVIVISLNLSVEEAQVLRDMLQQQHTSLLMEIAKTDAREYRTALQEREDVVRRITDQLEDGERRDAR